MKRLKCFCVAGLLLVVIGCSVRPQVNSGAVSSDEYALAIRDAAVIEQSEIVVLPLVRKDTVRVVTWTPYLKGYVAGKERSINFSPWVTLAGDVQRRCRKFAKAELVSTIQRLLGLREEDKQRNFVTMTVPRSVLFRPCANPSLEADRCDAKMADDVPASHREWYAGQTAKSYKLPDGFPWTRLGYTYNWNKGASEIGPTEFVIKKGSRVKVESIKSTARYCGTEG